MADSNDGNDGVSDGFPDDMTSDESFFTELFAGYKPANSETPEGWLEDAGNEFDAIRGHEATASQLPNLINMLGFAQREYEELFLEWRESVQSSRTTPDSKRMIDHLPGHPIANSRTPDDSSWQAKRRSPFSTPINMADFHGDASTVLEQLLARFTNEVSNVLTSFDLSGDLRSTPDLTPGEIQIGLTSQDPHLRLLAALAFTKPQILGASEPHKLTSWAVHMLDLAIANIERQAKDTLTQITNHSPQFESLRNFEFPSDVRNLASEVDTDDLSVQELLANTGWVIGRIKQSVDALGEFAAQQIHDSITLDLARKPDYEANNPNPDNVIPLFKDPGLSR